MRILVVDDEPAVREASPGAEARGLRRRRCAADGRGARASRRAPPDVMVLDVMMPGWTASRSAAGCAPTGDRTPVLMLTARDAVADRVRRARRRRRRLPGQAVRARGAARPRCARCCAAPAPRRTSAAAALRRPELDPVAHEVRRGERAGQLTRTEFELLELFLRHPRQVLPRAILERVWGYDFGPASNSLEVYVGYLRRKTEAAASPTDPHRARRRLRAAGAVSLRRRLALFLRGGGRVTIGGLRDRLLPLRDACATRSTRR